MTARRTARTTTAKKAAAAPAKRTAAKRGTSSPTPRTRTARKPSVTAVADADENTEKLSLSEVQELTIPELRNLAKKMELTAQRLKSEILAELNDGGYLVANSDAPAPEPSAPPAKKTTTRRTAAKKAAESAVTENDDSDGDEMASDEEISEMDGDFGTVIDLIVKSIQAGNVDTHLAKLDDAITARVAAVEKKEAAAAKRTTAKKSTVSEKSATEKMPRLRRGAGTSDTETETPENGTALRKGGIYYVHAPKTGKLAPYGGIKVKFLGPDPEKPNAASCSLAQEFRDRPKGTKVKLPMRYLHKQAPESA